MLIASWGEKIKMDDTFNKILEIAIKPVAAINPVDMSELEEEIKKAEAYLMNLQKIYKKLTGRNFKYFR